jgi:PAT family beta-lactamase induction signal transducer AmpG
MAHTLKDTFRALKDRKMLYMLLLGASSGLPFALTLGTLQAWMKDSSIDLKTIGLFAFLRLPFSLKFLWAPLMDRVSPPFLDRRRGWAFLTQGLLAAAIFAMALTDPASQIKQLLIITLLVNFFAASQDIVLDAYRREALNEEELGLGVGVFVNGYIMSFRYISGALALLLPTFIGWSQTYMVMAGIMALMMIITWTAPKIRFEQAAPRSLKEAFVGPLKEYFSRPEAYTVLAFVILYKVGDNMASTMTIPYFLEKGFTREEYVAIVKVLGPLATLLGAFVGGHYVMKLGIIRSLWAMGFLQAASTACYALLELTGKNNWVLGGIIGFENITAQMGTAAYAAYMASITNIRFTATQYALLSSLMAIPGVIFASRTGDMAASMGWTNFFLACALVAAPGMFLIPMLGKPESQGAKNIVRLTIIGITVIAGAYALIWSTKDILLLFFPAVAPVAT